MSTTMTRDEARIAVRRLSDLGSLLAPAAAHLRATDDATVRCQERLALIPAPTGLEDARALLVQQLLVETGATSRRDAVGNVIAEHPCAEMCDAVAPVVLLAHLDTVFDGAAPLSVTYDGSRILCPGIGDNSRGLAAMLSLAGTFATGAPLAINRTRGFARPIEFVATVGEEGLGNLRGARAYFADRNAAGKPKPHAVVVLDGPGDDNIVHHALGSRRYRIVFRGAGGHSWANFGAPNAVHAAGRATGWLANLPDTLRARIAVTVSRITGGESVNSIPAHACLEVDVRGNSELVLSRAEHEIERIVKAAAHAESVAARAAGFSEYPVPSGKGAPFHPLVYDIALIGTRPCGMLPNEHPLVALARAASIAHGVQPMSAIASTDANIPLSLGIPAITIGGGGSGGGAHTLDEWYDNTNGPRGISRALAIVLALAA